MLNNVKDRVMIERIKATTAIPLPEPLVPVFLLVSAASVVFGISGVLIVSIVSGFSAVSESFADSIVSIPLGFVFWASEKMSFSIFLLKY